jgi:hypothetical protein
MDLPDFTTGRAPRSRRIDLGVGNAASEGAFPHPSRAENHRMHDASGQQGEQPGDHQSAAEDADHDAAVAADMVALGADNGDRQQDQHQDRKQMDRAPNSLSWWIPNELAATVAISTTQIQPMVRCGSVPFGAANWTIPSASAAIAAKA